MNRTAFRGQSGRELNKHQLKNIDTFESFNAYKENLDNINLIEKDIKSLYKWEHLFNNYRPISCYTTINNEKNKNNNIKDNKNELFKSPILLVDLPESQMNLFFGKNFNESSSNKKKIKLNNKEKINSNHITNSEKANNISHNIRPMSMYSPRIQNSCYYYSSVFSDYYKEDFKSFCNKMPILKAKLKIDSDKLKREMYKHDKTTIMKEKILNKICSKESILLDKQDLIIAAQRRNPMPLLKSIFKQNYPGVEVMNDKRKMYFNTMKPYGNDDGNVDYQQNDRWKLSNEIIKMRNNNIKEEYKIDIIKRGKKKKRKLLLSYYDVNDPSIAPFNNIIKVENFASQKESESNNLKKIESQTYKNEKKQKINININIDQQINNINEIMDNKKTESNIETSTDRKKMNLKSKNVKSEEKNIKVNRKISNNSKTSLTLKNLGIKEDSLYNDYLSPNCFPLKTSSDVGNTSYNKINKLIREKKLLNKLKIDYSMTQSKTTRKSLSKYNFSEKLTNNKKSNNKNEDLNLILASKKIKPKKKCFLIQNSNK